MKKKFSKANIRKHLPVSIIIFIVLAAVIVTILVVLIPKKTVDKLFQKEEFSEVSSICELATLRCYYHDVVEDEKQPDGLFKYGFFRYGYKKIWIEYEGIVDIGVKSDKVRIQEPDRDGTIRIYVPEAEILNVDVKAETINESISDTGIFTKISIDEKTKLLSEAQKTMRHNAESDSDSLLRARNNAKEILKEHYIAIGKQTRQNYTIEWLDH